MRLGVGRSPVADAISHVLGQFSKAETPGVERLLDRAVEAAVCFVEEGVNGAMNKFNQIPTDSEDSGN